MRVALLSGAIKNAGDYLIVERSRALLQYMYADVEILNFVRNYSLYDDLEKVNTCNVVVLAGGPNYYKALYPESMPLVNDLSLIKPPLFILGAGWYGDTIDLSEVYGYSFNPSTMALFERISQDGGTFGCRDWYAVKVLANNGFTDSLMTGCPAWYALSCIDESSPQVLGSRLKIAVSDPANAALYGGQSIELVKALMTAFPDASITYFFHRGIIQDDLTGRREAASIREIVQKLDELGIPYVDISYGSEGFAAYDEYDFHVGHRVHAHIYNLSIRHRSILLEEDSRGAGVNEALGLFSVKAYVRKRKSTTPRAIRGLQRIVSYDCVNPYAVKELMESMKYVLKRDNTIFSNAYRSMQGYFECMQKHLAKIGEIAR